MKRIVLIALLLVPGFAQGAWLPGWEARLTVTSNSGLTDADPGYGRVPLSALGADFWDGSTGVNQTDGRDIRVTTSDGETKVPVEIVGFDATADTGAIFFKTALSTSVDTVLYIYYHNTSATMPAITDTYGAENVWTNFVMVQHLNEAGTATQLDSGANDNDGAMAGTMTTGDNVDGPTADWPALEYDGTDDVHTITAATGFDTAAMTFSGWFKKGVSAAGYLMGGGTDFTVGNRRFRILDVNYGGAFRGMLYYTWSGGEATWRHDETAEFPAAATWFHLALTYDASSTANDPILYLDGVATTALGESASPSGARSTGVDSIVIGGRNDSASPWSGTMAGVSWADSVRSADYIATQYAMESDPDAFWEVGGEQLTTSTPWKLGTIITDGGDPEATGIWGTLSNLSVNDTTYSQQIPEAFNYSSHVLVTGLGYSVPSDATVLGVEVQLDGAAEVVGEMVDYNLQLIKGGVKTGANRADTVTNWPTTFTSAFYGSSSDMWSTTLSYSDVNASNFGVAYRFYDDSGGDEWFRLYRIWVRVHYTTVPSGPSAADGARGFFVLAE